MSQRVVLSINASNYGCTGNIMFSIMDRARMAGFTTYTACAYDHVTKDISVENQIYIGNRVFRNIHQLLFKFTGRFDLGSHLSTWLFLKKVNKIKPDIIHLHIMHGNYINLSMLFKYCRKNKIKVIWTMHDCWALTGRCAYFEMNGCEKWRRSCGNCEYMRQYPSSRIDKSYDNLEYKKKIYGYLDNLFIVTPSRWLGNLVGQSCLANKRRRVIYNGIDLSGFGFTDSSLRERFGDQDKFIILFIATIWEKRKGFDYVVRLAERFGDCAIYLVGGLDKEQRNRLPSNIRYLGVVHDRTYMQQLYSIADVFVNPTLDDNFPTTNIEALACGTPVVTFETGGSAESIDENSGIAVKKGDFEQLAEAVSRTRITKFKKELCQARAERFSDKKTYAEYIDFYNEILGGES